MMDPILRLKSIGAAARFAPRQTVNLVSALLHSDATGPLNSGPTYQPQDGARPRMRKSLERAVTDLAPRFRRSAGEPEDARLTGGTRSLMRRLSGLNLSGLNLVNPNPSRPSVSAARPARSLQKAVPATAA